MADITSALQAAAGAAGGGGGGDPRGLIAISQSMAIGSVGIHFFEFDGSAFTLASTYAPATGAGVNLPLARLAFGKNSNVLASAQSGPYTQSVFNMSSNAIVSVAATYNYTQTNFAAVFNNDDSVLFVSSSNENGAYTIMRNTFNGSSLSFSAKSTLLKGRNLRVDYNYDETLILYASYCYPFTVNVSNIQGYETPASLTGFFYESSNNGTYTQQVFGFLPNPVENIVAVPANSTSESSVNMYSLTGSPIDYSRVTSYAISPYPKALTPLCDGGWNALGTRLVTGHYDASYNYNLLVLDWDTGTSTLSFNSTYLFDTRNLGAQSGIQVSPSGDFVYVLTLSSSYRYISAFAWAEDGSLSFAGTYTLDNRAQYNMSINTYNP